MIKKIIAVILCMLFLVGCVPSPAPSTESTLSSQTITLKTTSQHEKDLQHYEQEFSASAWFEPFNWNAQAFCAIYDSPENLDLAAFFWNGIGTQVLTDAEEDFIKQAKVDSGYDVARIDVAEASAVLERCFGITWEEANGVGLDRLLYNEKENCYYLAANGANILSMLDIHSCTRKEDGSVCLTYSTSGLDLKYAITFFEQESSEGVRYRFVSNLPCE